MLFRKNSRIFFPSAVSALPVPWQFWQSWVLIFPEPLQTVQVSSNDRFVAIK